MTDFKYLDVCSGISAPTVAWKPLGWQCVAYSEIEKFPSAVLAHHYPDIPNLGDMNEFRNWPAADIDLLVGGTPCQSFSVAGLREGLKDPRGNLALTYLAIAERYRPTWLVWENVPGVLSSHRGRDFGSILGAMVELGYGFAYRVLDAQYFGVPQRRRRVFVVGCLGDWRRAAEVLFEPESLCRNPPPSREAGERVADSLTVGANQCSGFQSDITESAPAVANPLTARMHKGINTTLDEGQTPIVTHAFVPNVHATVVARSSRGGGQTNSPGHNADESLVAIGFAQNQRDEVRLMDKAGAPAAEPGAKQQTYVAFTASAQANSYAWERDVYPTLNAQIPNDTSNIQQGVRCGMAVRRLTPRECERLQGFPDDYTRIAWRNKAPEDCPDGPRYKALGNSMAVPVLAWIGRRIQEVDQR